MSNNDVKKNPTWTRDELILALDVYFELDAHQMTPQEPKILVLSNLLNDLPIHDDRKQNVKFRNPVGVSMKLRNFLRFDSTYQGRGLARGGQLEEVVWSEFAQDRNRLQKTAHAIREIYQELVEHQRLGAIDDSSEVECPEGKILLTIHRLRERNRALIEKKKEQVFRQTQMLACEVCEFDFGKKYGELGYGFAECHHIVPLASLTYRGLTSLKDLAIVCANCHRMFHRSRTWLSVDALKLRIATPS